MAEWVDPRHVLESLQRKASPSETARLQGTRMDGFSVEQGPDWIDLRAVARDPGGSGWRVHVRVDPTRVEGRCGCGAPGWPCRHILGLVWGWVDGAGWEEARPAPSSDWRALLHELAGGRERPRAGEEALVHWVERAPEPEGPCGLVLSWRVHRFREGVPGPGRRVGWRALAEGGHPAAEEGDRAVAAAVRLALETGGRVLPAGVRVPAVRVDPVLRALSRARFVYERTTRRPVRFEPNPVRPVIEAVPEREGLRLRVRWTETSGEPWDPDEVHVLGEGPAWVWASGPVIRPVLSSRGGGALARLAAGGVGVPEADVPAFLGVFVPELEAGGMSVDIQALRTRNLVLEPRPVPRLYLSEEDGELIVRLHFRYGDVEVAADNPEPTVRVPAGGRRAYLQRDMEAEFRAARQLQAAGLKPAEPGLFVLRGEDALEFLHERLPALARRWEVLGEENLVRYRVARRPVTLRVSLRSGVDWLDLSVEASAGEAPVPVERVLAALRRGGRYVRLDDGSYARLARSWAERLAAALGDVGLRHGRARVPVRMAPVVEEILEVFPDAEWEDGERLKERMEALRRVPALPPPAGFRGTLRPYQLQGYAWLRHMGNLGCGAVLADDMGLGKTVQALAVLLAEKDEPGGRPNLVVAPTSVVPNWEQEARRFAPQLAVLRYHGAARPQEADRLAGHDLVITSYALLRRDLEILSAVEWNWVVLDEAQAIKNPATQTARAVRELRARRRMALTGTPLENHMGELWSLFQFLNPGLLGGERAFVRRYVRPILQGDTEARESLRRRIAPFVLRRLKAQVAPELPEKVESVLWCEMTPEQEALYRSVLEANRARVFREIERKGLARARFSVLEALLRLRQVCCLPEVLPGGLGEGVPSGKFDRFREAAIEVLEEGHRLLVFSQFTRVLGRLRRWFEEEGIEHLYLDGRTRNREQKVRRFQEDERVRVFLVSLKAGGAGLNLTGADYVILYDPWWNPAVETQATDRAHRIGQTRKVFAYRMITRGTVEEKILELQERKRELSEGLIGAGGEVPLSEEDVRDLLEG